MMNPYLVPDCPSCPQMYRMDPRILNQSLSGSVSNRGLGQGIVEPKTGVIIMVGLGVVLLGAYVFWAWATSPVYERYYDQPLRA